MIVKGESEKGHCKEWGTNEKNSVGLQYLK